MSEKTHVLTDKELRKLIDLLVDAANPQCTVFPKRSEMLESGLLYSIRRANGAIEVLTGPVFDEDVEDVGLTDRDYDYVEDIVREKRGIAMEYKKRSLFKRDSE